MSVTLAACRAGSCFPSGGQIMLWNASAGAAYSADIGSAVPGDLTQACHNAAVPRTQNTFSALVPPCCADIGSASPGEAGRRHRLALHATPSPHCAKVGCAFPATLCSCAHDDSFGRAMQNFLGMAQPPHCAKFGSASPGDLAQVLAR